MRRQTCSAARGASEYQVLSDRSYLRYFCYHEQASQAHMNEYRIRGKGRQGLCTRMSIHAGHRRPPYSTLLHKAKTGMRARDAIKTTENRMPAKGLAVTSCRLPPSPLQAVLPYYVHKTDCLTGSASGGRLALAIDVHRTASAAPPRLAKGLRTDTARNASPQVHGTTSVLTTKCHCQHLAPCRGQRSFFEGATLKHKRGRL
jgi:hypothetical protein